MVGWTHCPDPSSLRAHRGALVEMKELLSPKQVATSIGVSESSLKRWCDQGVIATERTPGGHRRIRVGEVVQFLRSQQRSVVRPEALGLPVGVGGGAHSVETTGQVLIDALKQGDRERCRRLVIDLYLSGTSVVSICERVLTPALYELGESWECGELEVYQERRACESLGQTLYDLRTLLPATPASAPAAIGGAPSGDQYRLPTLMVELVLAAEGWNAMSLGTSLPLESMAAAARRDRPKLFWISFSHVEDPASTRLAFSRFLETTPEEMSVVVGGQKASQTLGDALENRRVHYGADLASLRRIAIDLRPGASGSDG